MYKIILAAMFIPVGSTVTKKTGQKSYVLKDKITIYGDSGPQVISAECNSRLLVARNGDANIVEGDLELMWEATREELLELLNEDEYDDEDRRDLICGR